MPILLETDTRPVLGSDGANALGIIDEEVPGADASIDDGLVAVPDQGGEFVGPQQGPTFSMRFSSGA